MSTAVITGSNAGLGLATATELARKGHSIVMAVRNAAKGETAAAEVRAAVPNANVRVVPLDLASLASIRSFAGALVAEYPQLELLVNNAGITMKSRTTTTDGFETTFGVNHLGHFLLTNLLHDPLAAAGGLARVVVVASDAHKMARGGLNFDDLQSTGKYSPLRVYGASKLANILFTREIARRWKADGITVNAVHPGFVATRLGRDGDGGRLGDIAMILGKPFARTPAQGARTSVFVATAPELASVTGEYFANEKRATPNTAACDDTAAARLWEVSTGLVGL
jgi:NAD(P)-dependent dehydrogenase (short-subunit alcohol dehydrogenase family)